MENLNKLVVPFRLLPLMETPLNVRAGLRQRYHYMSEAYAKEAAALRREFSTLEIPEPTVLYKDYEAQVRMYRFRALTANYAPDVALNLWKLDSNFRYAKANDNRFLIRDNIMDFPCMNYVTGEGPYTPGHHDRITGQDNHCVIYAARKLWCIFKDTLFESAMPVERL